MTWHVIVTSPQREFRVAERLDKAGVERCLPYVTKDFYKKGRVVRLVQRAWFSRYVFVVLRDSHDLDTVRNTPGVVAVICTAEGMPAEVPESVMAELLRYDNGYVGYEGPNKKARLKIGDMLSISLKGGVWAGKTGVICRTWGRVYEVDLGGLTVVKIPHFWAI